MMFHIIGMDSQKMKEARLPIRKKKRKNSPDGSYRLNSLTIKEITCKYKDKFVGGRTENGRAVLMLDTCKIKYVWQLPAKKDIKYEQ